MLLNPFSPLSVELSKSSSDPVSCDVEVKMRRQVGAGGHHNWISSFIMLIYN